MTYNLSEFLQDLQKERDELNVWVQLNAMIEIEWIGAANRMKMFVQDDVTQVINQQSNDVIAPDMKSTTYFTSEKYIV